MKIENLDEARRLGCLRDLLLSMIRHLSKEERLKQMGYSCNDNGQRTLVIDLSVNK